MSTPEEEKARRTARAIASDVKLYNQKKLTPGGDPRQLLKSEIAEGLALYNQKVDPKVRALGDFFEDALELNFPRVASAPAPARAAVPAPAPVRALAPSPPASQTRVPPPASPSANPDDAADRQVFAEVVASRKKCGEPVSAQSYEQFAALLRRNREQLLQKYGGTAVRFEVYAKDGKTAVKPVVVGGKATKA